MIELLDPQEVDIVAYSQGVLSDIRKFSLLPDRRIGWNYCMDYTWLAMQCQDYLKSDMVVLDIGCGPGAVHGYLEDRYAVRITGIDMHRWKTDYVDIEGDFTSKRFRKNNGISRETVDCIISISAFEHNKPKKHRKLVNACFDCLKPSGRLIVTFAATNEKPNYFKPSAQWNLDNTDVNTIYGERIQNIDQYCEIWQRWHDHKFISEAYLERYGSWCSEDPPFLSVGANINRYSKNA